MDESQVAHYPAISANRYFYLFELIGERFLLADDFHQSFIDYELFSLTNWGPRVYQYFILSSAILEK